MSSNMPKRNLPTLMICDDDTGFHHAAKLALKGRFEFRAAYHTDEALAILRNHSIDLLLLDIQMRTPDEGLKAIPRFLQTDPELPIIVASGLTDYRIVKEAMRLGAVDYVAKDFDPEDLAHVSERVLERRALLLRGEQQNFEAAAIQKKHAMIGESPGVLKIRRMIERIRQSPANVLIQGETGTGKEVVARLLRGTLSDGTLAPFVAVDSSTIQSTTAESLLFGHEKGAFTGAEKSAKGIFEEANGGIVYFDEIANMPLEIQAKLLRVIQEKEITRLGSTRVIPLEFRVVAATNRNLDRMVEQGLFKADLVQRLNVLPVEIPPLRERREDIPLLVAHFLAPLPGQGIDLTFTEPALQALKNYPWPGNVRELSNLIAYVTTMTDGPEIDLADLPPKFRDAAFLAARATGGNSTQEKAEDDAGTGAAQSFYDQVATFEKKILAEEYSRSGGNISRLALKLGMDRSHLHAKLKEHAIHKPAQREKSRE